MARIRQSSSNFGVSNGVPRVSSTRALISRPYFDWHPWAHVGKGHGRRGGGASRRRNADGVAHAFHVPPPPVPPPPSSPPPRPTLALACGGYLERPPALAVTRGWSD